MQIKNLQKYFLAVLSFSLLSAIPSFLFAQGRTYVKSGSEFTNFGTIDLSTPSNRWTTERGSSPGYFSAVGSAAYQNPTDLSAVDGYVKHYATTANQAFHFPVMISGLGGAYRGLSISGTRTATSQIAVAWIQGNPSSTFDLTLPYAGLHDVELLGAGLQSVSSIGQWDWQDITNDAAGLTVTVRIPDLSTFGPAADLRLVGWAATKWINLSSSGALANTANSSLSGVMVSGITAIGIGLSINSVLVQVGNEADEPNEVPSVVTAVQLASIPGVTGVVPANETAYRTSIDNNPDAFSAPATVEQINGMIREVNAEQNTINILTQVGNEGDSPNTVPSEVTAIQLASVPGVTAVVFFQYQAAYRAYIDANPDEFSAPATVDEINAMINLVNTDIILTQVGNEGDSPNTVPSVVTVDQLVSVSGVTGVVPENETAYRAYIDANPDVFSAPATVAEINAMITAVNAAIILIQVGNEGDSPNTIPSVVTAVQLASVPGVTATVYMGNQTSYREYIDANPNLFSAPATVAEINAMVTAVNSANILTQVGNEGDEPNEVPSVVTTVQLASIPGVTGVVPANETAYRAYIDANPDAFSSPATVAEINAMITAANYPVDLSPTLEIDDLEFVASGNNKDFLVNLYEIAGYTTSEAISFRISKLSAFTITYPTSSTSSDVFGGTMNSNEDFTFTETGSSITVNSKSGVNISAKGLKAVGFNVARKSGISAGTLQNLTITILNSSGGDVDSSNNISITRITAN
jgi:hypothetical protein